MSHDGSEVCVCGHDDITHRISIVAHGGRIRGRITSCVASLGADPDHPTWCCGCDLFQPQHQVDTSEDDLT